MTRNKNINREDAWSALLTKSFFCCYLPILTYLRRFVICIQDFMYFNTLWETMQLFFDD